MKATSRSDKNIVQLTILLLKEGATYDDAFDMTTKGVVTRLPVQQDQKQIGILVVKQTPDHPPNWAAFFSDAVNFNRRDIHGASVSAAYVTQASSRLFALCFGHGRHLINSAAVEERFGLRVTLNAVDPEQLRAVELTTLEANPIHGKRQPSRAGSLGEFGLNLDQDLMRGVTGKPINESLGSVMTGADSLSVRVRADLSSAPRVLSKYLATSRENTYKEKFAWVDHVAEVHDAHLKAELFECVVEGLKKKGKFIWAAIPEVVDWAHFDFFRFGTPASGVQSEDDITLDKFKEALDGEMPTLELLKRKQVFCIAKGNAQPIMHWSFLKCLTAEVSRRGARYLLNAGTWFKVDTDFAKRVADDIAEIPEADLQLEDWGLETEAAYNERVAKKSKGRLALMDRELVAHPGMVSPIEFCDLFSTSGHMIHVKRYGQSSVLSHLFAQGTVAANTVLSDADFRRAANKKLPESHRFKKPEERLDPSKHEVCFAIGSSEPGKLQLPFFSQVTLRNSYRTLRHSLGFNVSIKKIAVSKLTDTR
jgi:uncharacterized protein (TIGR04141 family)